MKKYILPVLLVILVSGDIFSQAFYNYRRGRDIIASLGTGTATYFGDLNDPGDYFDAKPSLNIGLQYFFTDRIAARAEVNWFRLQGVDNESESDGRVVRNLSFRSDNFEVNVVGIINAFSNGTRFYQRQPVNVYGFAGIGLLYFNPKAQVPETQWSGTSAVPMTAATPGDYIALQPLNTEGADYAKTTFVIPFGAGLKFKVGPFFNVGLEVGYRKTFTDYLDDVSTTYLDHSTLSAEPLRQAMADRRHEIGLEPYDTDPNKDKIRGDPDDKDGYAVYNLKIEFYLPQQIMSTSKSRRGARRGRRR